MAFIDRENIDKITETAKAQLGANSKVGLFIMSMKNRMGIGSPERNATDVYERKMNIIPENIRANENEIPVKQYNVAVLRNMMKFERAEGRLQVTNKRMVFRAAGRSLGGRTSLHHEYKVDEIAGIEARSNYRFSFCYLVLAFLIISLASAILYSPSDLMNVIPGLGGGGRFSTIMRPTHLIRAHNNVTAAVSRRAQAEEAIIPFEEMIAHARQNEEFAAENAREGIQRTRRVETGRDWWGNMQYRNETYRDTSAEGLREAQTLLAEATAEREGLEAEEAEAQRELAAALANETSMIRRRASADNLWRVFIVVFALVLGIGGIIPFFTMYKKFGLKLFLLNFSMYGFSLALATTGFRFFNILYFLAVLTTLVCIFIFCFRPNLVISIKNRVGTGVGPVDIRAGTFSNRLMELTGFAEVLPTEETEGAIREIGAMIGDIQKLGDQGAQNWKQR